MDTAPSILEIGLLLLAAATLGWTARRLGLPAVVGYLALGLAVSPFTPGFVADRGQLQLLADLGVVLLLFEVGIEVDLVRLRREQRGLLWASPLQVVLPRVLHALRDQHDLFLITSVASGLALAGLGAVIFDVPLALAAFVGGLAITESPVAAEARRRLLPFRAVSTVLIRLVPVGDAGVASAG